MQQIKSTDSLAYNLYSEQRQVDSTKDRSKGCNWVANTIKKVVELSEVIPRNYVYRGEISHPPQLWLVVL